MSHFLITVILIFSEIINNMQPGRQTMDKAFLMNLVVLNAVLGDIFEYPESYRFLYLTCLGSGCGISKTEQALQCRMNKTCIAISWKLNDTCHFCRCQTEPLHSMPLDTHFGSMLLLRKAFARLPGKYSMIYQLLFLKQAFLSNIHITTIMYLYQPLTVILRHECFDDLGKCHDC